MMKSMAASNDKRDLVEANRDGAGAENSPMIVDPMREDP